MLGLVSAGDGVLTVMIALEGRRGCTTCATGAGRIVGATQEPDDPDDRRDAGRNAAVAVFAAGTCVDFDPADWDAADFVDWGRDVRAWETATDSGTAS